MALTVEHAKEDFGKAYVAAVAASICAMAETPPRDYDSVDFRVERPGGHGPWLAPRINMQLKTTAVPNYDGDFLLFDLPVDDYDDLRATDVTEPRILVVVVVPRDLQAWIGHTGDDLVLRHRAYWASLYGMAPVENRSTRRVRLPRWQRLDGPQLSRLLDRVEEGAWRE